MKPNTLPQHIIGLDIETTSLEPAAGDIIEVAAIRYDLKRGEEIERFDRLAQPTAPITAEITSLTGITQEMVEDQPPFAEHQEELIKFIGDDIIFAHNAPFDIGFLAYHGAKLSNNVWDTFPLASIAWPEATSYNLGTLVDMQGIEVAGEHRAAADIMLTWELLKEIRRQLAVSSASHQHVTATLTKASLTHYLPLFTIKEKAKASKPPVTSQPGTNAIDTADLTNEKVFGDGGVLVYNRPNFSARPGQLLMAEHVSDTIRKQGTTLIEAGTGTGKTFAYAVPLLLQQEAEQVVISTHTKTLQDQLVQHDFPELQEALGTTKKVALLKGRRNYLCNRRFRQFLARKELTPEAAFVALKVISWLDHGGNGDLEQLNMSHQGERFLRAISADAISCRLNCTAAAGCPYQLARQRAARADIIVVNHALLVRISLGDEAAINPQIIVIDEAHHLEEAARHATELDLSEERVRDITTPMSELAQASDDARSEHIVTECEALVTDYAKLIDIAGAYVDKHSRSSRIRLSAGVRRSNEWRQVALASEKWRGRLKFTLGLTRSTVADLPAKKKKIAEESIKQAEQFNIELEQFMIGNPERIQWIESWLPNGQPTKRITTLIDVALSLEAILSPVLSDDRATILTSATLTTGGNFDYIKNRLGIDEAVEHIIDTSLPYADNMLIYLVDNAPNPSGPEYDEYIAKQLANISKAVTGRILAIFTAQRAVANTYQIINKSLSKEKIKVYAQKITGGKTNIIKRFKKTAASVLLGTDSFWEGIDIPGDSLSLVVIPKLPFPLPDDPITEAIAETEEINAFMQISLPQMILKLRQGIGRLLRHETDQGVVIIFDSRLQGRAYGADVIKSFPPAQVHIGSTADLIPKITEWFGADQLRAWRDAHQG